MEERIRHDYLIHRGTLVTQASRNSKNYLYPVQWAGLFFAVFISALFIAWHLLASVNFFYSLLYQPVGIEENIATYGPKNTVRPFFHLTDKQEHVRLFSAIVDAIHNDGKGLQQLTYHTPQGRALGPFLTTDEIIHLRDVAHLINGVNLLGSSALLVAIGRLALIIGRREKLPSLKRYHLIGLLGLVTLVGMVFIIGAESLFYQFHIWLFPENNQWFFYYEESLMSMFMRAPDLFAYIAVELLAVGLILYAAMLLVIYQSMTFFNRQ